MQVSRRQIGLCCIAYELKGASAAYGRPSGLASDPLSISKTFLHLSILKSGALVSTYDPNSNVSSCRSPLKAA
jgi:hypothetical protein